MTTDILNNKLVNILKVKVNYFEYVWNLLLNKTESDMDPARNLGFKENV